MATLLDTYQACKAGFENEALGSAPGPAELLRRQEIMYRICVLDTCQMFVKAAPESVDVGILVQHYQIVDAYFHNLTLERKYGINPDGDIKKQRETAFNNLCLIIQDYRKRFGSFAPGNDPGCYRKTISGVIQTVLPVWIQYRQTYLEIKKEAA